MTKNRTHLIVFVILAAMMVSCSSTEKERAIVSGMKCNGLINPVGTNPEPDFSWIILSDVNGFEQTAYQIVVSTDSIINSSSRSIVWNSDIINSSETYRIKYNGTALQQNREYFWRVRIWDGDHKPLKWSRAASFVTALNADGWKDAKWIGYEEISDSLLLVPGVHGNGDNLKNKALKRTIVPYFRKEFTTGQKIAKAYLSVCGLGQYEFYINGNRTGDSFLSPGWTDYRKTCLFNTYDVTADLKKGNNTIGAIVGNGFYNINRERYRKLVIAYGAPVIIAKLTIQYSDGSTQDIVSDGSWRTAPSPITFTSIYGGEDYDARLEKSGWNKNGFSAADWKNALEVSGPEGKLIPEYDNPVKITNTIKYRKISNVKDRYVYDFGQNASGVIHIKVRGSAGQEVRFVPGEILGADSLVSQKASGEPYYFSYTLHGNGTEEWTPRFTYYGFRYIQLEGAIPAGPGINKDLPVVDDIELEHCQNSSPETGSFACSDTLMNSIYNLIKWSVKNNIVSVATDCPHREKLGWLEQAHLMGNSMQYLFDISNFGNKIASDMIDAQTDNGLIPDIAPEYVPFEGGFRDSPEWGSAAVILPWQMYQWYGDRELLRRAYPMMKRYVDFLETKSFGLILSHGLGDWYDLGPEFPGEAQLTPIPLTATAMFYYDTKILSSAAGVLGNKDDASLYSSKANEIKKAFNKKFFNNKTKIYSTGSQTAMSMPLSLGLVEEKDKSAVVTNLVKKIADDNNSLTSGDIGYRYLLKALDDAGQSELIYRMNSRSDKPGYGYQLKNGATALTESWSALKDVSNDHMMLGHLLEWFYGGIGGIKQAPGSVAYNKVIINPQVVGDITHAETQINTVHGIISCDWRLENNNIIMKIRIPVNCEALVTVPQVRPDFIFNNEVLINQSTVINISEVTRTCTVLSLSSGEYNIRAHYTKSK